MKSREGAGDPGSSPLWRWLGFLALAAAIWWLWNTPVIYPLKILVVFFHELSHGLAAVLTGGSITGIEVVAREGGVCRTIGGNRFLTLTAGYLGSLLVGGVILLVAARTRQDRLLAVALGGVLLLTALFWVRPLLGFGFPFAVLAGAALILGGLYLPEMVVDGTLQVIGLTSMLYALLDIKDDILDRPEILESDAAQLAALTGVPTLVWGVLWIGLGAVAAWYFLRLAGGSRRAPADE